MTFSLFHWFGLIATVAVAMGLGIRGGTGSRTAEGFSLGGRSSGVAVIAGGIAGTVIGGAATIGTAQMAYAMGLSAWWFTLGCGLGFVLIGRFFARPLRKSGLETISQYLVINYGKAAGPIASIASSLGILFSAVASSLSGIHLVAGLFGIGPAVSAVVIVVLVLGYVLVGGMKGAGLAGLFKLAVIWGTLFAAGAVAVTMLAKVPDFATRFPFQPWFNLMGSGVLQSCAHLFSLIVGIICTQTYIQALYAASDSRTAAAGAYTAALITIPVGLPSVAVGMAMRISHPDIAPILALPVFLMEHLPSTIAGIGIGGLLLSVVGSIAGLTLGIGTMISRDIGQAILGIESDRRILAINRTTVLLVTALSAFIAASHLDSYVLDWNYMSMALRGSGIFLPLVLAILLPRALHASWAIAAMGVGTAAAVGGRLILDLAVNPLYLGLGASGFLVILGLLASRRS